MSSAVGGWPATLPSTLPAFSRTTDLAHWNRFAAVNDEFIDVHMSADAARATGQPDAFGMGTLRVAYHHALLHAWLGGRGDIRSYTCEFRAVNHRHDTLTTWGRVLSTSEVGGRPAATVELGVRNQDGVETTPATADVLLLGTSSGLPPLPRRRATVPREPGTHLDAATLEWLGRSLPVLHSYPVGANDIRRWCQAAWYPSRPPFDLADGEQLVAPRDFNPFAWHPRFRPDAYPWMRGMGTEPGRRGLNGGLRAWHGAAIRPGDVIGVEVTLVDAYEREGSLGPMLFLVDESRWHNQDGDEVRAVERTTIYY